MIREDIISAHHIACFERDVFVLNRHRLIDEVDHFSAHAIMMRVDALWTEIMTDEERQYVEDERQAIFDQNMLMLEIDRG